MTPLRQPMIAALQRSGQGARTQEASVREVRLLAPCSGTAPPLLSAQALQDSCLHRTNVDGLAPASMRRCSSGSRCFSQHVRTRDGHTLAVMRAPTAHRLPALLSGEAVRRLRKAATPVHHQASCTPVSRVGLRRHAALSLQPAESDSPRRQVPGHRGTGATDRDVPRPAETLRRLRASWTPHRNTTWRLPAPGREQHHRSSAASPRRRPRGQGACRTATPRAGLTTTGVALPPLRHAYATPLRDAGVPPRLLQRSLGPTQRATTRRSFHRTHPGPAEADERLNALRHGLLP
jgi:hypothetical protein